MLPDHYIATTCGCESPGRLELENGLAIKANAAIEVLQKLSEEKHSHYVFLELFLTRVEEMKVLVQGTFLC